MPIKNRTKISACYNSFIQEISKLERFDFNNHKKFGERQLSRAQIELMVESIFFTGFRAYESFIREIFILYCMGKQNGAKKIVKSYIKPKNFEHSELLVKSSMHFLDWNSPEQIITRAELFLADGYPIKLPYTSNLQQLKDFKKLRNHIAHNSLETETHFEKIVRQYYNGIRPLKPITPGQYLMLSSKINNNNYLLLDFFGLMKQISVDLT